MKYRIAKEWKTDTISGKEVEADFDRNMRYNSNEIMKLIKTGYSIDYNCNLYCLKKVERIGLSEITTFMILEEV